MQHQRVLEEELKSVNLVQFINARSPLEPVGRCFRGNCCAHDDRDRSLFVYPEREQWRCFAPHCEAGGDVVAFLMAAEKISHSEAIRKLAVQYGLSPKQSTAHPMNTSNPGLVDDHDQTHLFGPGSVEFLMRRAKRLERVLDVDALDTDQLYELLFEPTISQVDDRKLTAGNLAMVGKIYDGRMFAFRSMLKYQEPRTVGILISMPTTIQEHAEIETADGEVHIEDTTKVYDCGTITWCEGEAIYKDEEGTHFCTTLLGCSSRGFCLIEVEGAPSPLWVFPRDPRGRDRLFPYRKSGESKTSILTLESFFIQNSLEGPIPESFTDISGVTVPINIPESSSNRHSDRMRLIDRDGN